MQLERDGSTTPEATRASDARMPGRGVLAWVGPGLLVAATGVGAGDLATAGFAGSKLGYAVLWAVVLGAGIKFVLNEGLARWQIATGTTLLEGMVTRFGRAVMIVFGVYIVAWSFFVGSALISACGVTMHGLVPFPSDLGVFKDEAQAGKVVYGAAHSVVGVVLVWLGGFRWFERVMGVCVALMAVAVIVTAVLVRPDWGAVAAGVVSPRVPRSGDPLQWTVAVMGGVGGTLTVLAYSYWMREAGRGGGGTGADGAGAAAGVHAADMKRCRVDLLVGYSFSALFGVAMIIIASGIEVSGRSSGLIVGLAGQLEAKVGPAGRWVFLVGAWAAVASSLLGVWQSVPYIATDYAGLMGLKCRRVAGGAIDPRGWAYRGYLIALAVVPIAAVMWDFSKVQKRYAIMGAAFIPILGLVLLVLNGRKAWIGERFRNRWWTQAVLVATLVLTVIAAWMEVTG